MKIKIDNLEDEKVKKLLLEHHNEMLKHSPAESVHALDITSLKATNITFWTAWIDDELAGFCALKKLNDPHAELKSMRTSSRFLRKGVAAELLNHLLLAARKSKFTRVSLETGTTDAFIPAQKLYKRFGFIECKPFSSYQDDPYSMFLTKTFN